MSRPNYPLELLAPAKNADFGIAAIKHGADALIIRDMGLLEMNLPSIQLHASTQTDNRKPAKVRFLEDAGFSQVVWARELSLN